MKNLSLSPSTSLVAVLAACSGGTTIVVDVPDAARADVSETVAGMDALPGPDGKVDVLAPVDVVDLSPEARSSCRGPGCFGAPCSSGTDCHSGMCVEHMGNQVCTDYCIEECPDGWTCKMLEMGGPDPVYVCISDFSHLCVPWHQAVRHAQLRLPVRELPEIRRLELVARLHLQTLRDGAPRLRRCPAVASLRRGSRSPMTRR
jgi:hypothetical protein